MRLRFAILSFVAFAGCSREPTTSSPVTESSNAYAVDDNLRIESRFRLSLRATGSFTPGDTIEITAVVSTPYGASDAAVTVAAPEIEIATQAKWDLPFVVPEGVTITPAGEWSQSMSPGTSRTYAISVRPLKAGYYRVVLGAKARGQEVASTNGRVIHGTGVLETWLFVSDTGGGLHYAPDLHVFPKGTVKALGPFRSFRDSRIPKPSRIAPGVASPSYYRLVYYNADLSAYVPVPSYFVDIDWYDNFSGFLGTLQTAADADGYWPLLCPNSGEWYDVSPVLDNYNLLSSPRAVADGFTLTYDSCSDPDGGTMQGIAINSDYAHVYTNLDITVGNSYSFFGLLRPQAKYRIASASTNSYSPTDDRITITPNSVWGDYGIHVHAHEYGHAFHEKALGGIVAGPVCPDLVWGAGEEHPYDGPQNLRCALVEGFASYHAWVTRGSAAWHFAEVETNATLDPGEDGSIVPHAVSAFLYDLTDSGTEGHDAVTYPGSYVANIIKTCTNRIGTNTWPRANGVDMTIWCFEKAVDPSITTNPAYFATRSPDPNAQSEQATEPPTWSQSAIRTIWLENLYPF